MNDAEDGRAGQVPEIGDYRLDQSRPAPPRRRWFPLAAVLATGAVVASGVVVHIVASGASSTGVPGTTSRTPSSATTAEPSASAPADAGLVVRDGSVIQGSGRVVKVPGKAARFCAPVPMAAVGYEAGHEPPPQWCALGVDVTGVDLSTLDQPRTKAGATEGVAFLRGTYQGGVLHVTVQTGQRNSSGQDFVDVNPSACPKRAGGWQPVPSGSNPSDGLQTLVAKFVSRHPDEVVTQAVARPNAHALYLVITVQQVALAEKELPVRPGYLCVLPARWTRAQIDAARRPWESAMPQRADDPGAGSVTPGEGVWGVGESVDREAQSSVGVDLVMVTPDLEKLALSAPAGMVHLQPWLVPVQAGAPLPAPVATYSPQPLSSAGLASWIAASAAASSRLAASAAAPS